MDTDQLTQELLVMFPVATERQKFGPEGEPGVQVVLPITYSSPQNPPCKYKYDFHQSNITCIHF